MEQVGIDNVEKVNAVSNICGTSGVSEYRLTLVGGRWIGKRNFMGGFWVAGLAEIVTPN